MKARPAEEWTPEYVDELLGQIVANGVKRIADAHNAALAAEREERAIIERSREAWKSQVTGLTEALAAERDKAKRLEEALEEARRDEK